jgi:WD40-like Beta Propeller Repeat
LFRTTAVGSDFGRLAAVPAADPAGARTVAGLSCDRVYAANRIVLCLHAEGGVIARYHAAILDADLRMRTKIALEGAPSRARLSADGRMASWTVFMFGDSYTSVAFSTRTSILDTRTGHFIDSLEKFTAYQGGEMYRQPDINYWGVSFAADDNTFYATMASRHKTWLVRGDVARSEVHLLRENAECPSLSPDGTRLIFKKKISDDVRWPWRLHVLDVVTMRETPLAESRSVDDQAVWLDDRTVAYALPQPSGGSSDVWAVSADGTGSPRLLIPNASSPVPLLPPSDSS